MNKGTIRNILVTIAAQLVSWGLTILITLFLPRYLGDSGLGKLAFASSLISIFGVVVPLGTSSVLIKEIARDRGRTGELLQAVLFLRLPLAFVMMGLAIGCVTLLGYPALTRTLVIVGCVAMLVENANEALSAALKGQENLPKQTGSMLIERFVGTALTLLIIVLKAPIWTIAGIGIVTSAIGFAVNYPAFAPLLKSLQGLPKLSMLKSVALAGLPFLGWSAFQTLYGQIDPLALSIVAGDAAAGWYAAAFRLVSTTLFLPVAITTALMPTLSRLYSSDSLQFGHLARQMLGMILVCGVPIALVLICIPDVLLHLLHYPSSFDASIPVLRIGGVGVLLWYIAIALGTSVIASDGQSGMLRASMLVTFFSVPFCFLASYLTHRFLKNGAIGAITSDVVTESILLCFYLKLLQRGCFGWESISLFARCLVSAIPLAICLLAFTHPYGLLIALGSGTLAYAVLCLATRCIEPRQLVSLLQSAIAARQSTNTLE